jgi:hypothetical protein
MFKYFAILIIAFNAMPFSFASNGNSNIFNNLSSSQEQGGSLEFETGLFYSWSNSGQNFAVLKLNNYEGQPLKAIQFDIKIHNPKGKLNIKSIERGLDIPSDRFLLDFEIYRGELTQDNSSYDIVKVVILGHNQNVLIEKDSYELVKLVYEVQQIDTDTLYSELEILNLVGATNFPVKDAELTAGGKSTIVLIKAAEIKSTKNNLLQNYPNPFNPTTIIKFEIIESGYAEIKVFNSIGEEVKTLLSEFMDDGIYEVMFDASNMSTGIYYYQLTSNNSSITKKMILIK